MNLLGKCTEQKHALRALGVLLAVVMMAGCTDATPTPTAADIPDEPEAPPNTETPLGDPINPDPPHEPPTPCSGGQR